MPLQFAHNRDPKLVGLLLQWPYDHQRLCLECIENGVTITPPIPEHYTVEALTDQTQEDHTVYCDQCEKPLALAYVDPQGDPNGE